MDPSLQRLLDRTIARRENLQKKMAEMNTPVRKRPVPLAESDADNVSAPIPDDESPKRPKIREEENMVHQDTPSIPSVKSRLHRLTSKDNEENKMEATSSVTVTVDVTESAMPTNRRARLAALACNINNWEDDLSHHNIKPEEKPVKRVWQPPKPPGSDERPNTASDKSSVALGPSKPPRIFSDYKEDLETKKKFSPVKFSPSKVRSPEKDLSSEKKVSQITVQIGSKAQPETTEARQLRFVEGRTTNVSSADVINHAARSPVKAAQSPIKNREPARSPVKAAQPVIKTPATQVVQMRSKSNRRESFEPTSLPVSQRMSCWEQRVVESEQSKEPVTPRPKSVYAKGGTPAVATPVIKGKEEPKSLQLKRAAWQQKVNEVMMSEEAGTPKPRAFGTPAPLKATPAAQRVSSPVKSPAKVGAATRNLAEKIQTKLESNWQNNDIAERMKQQKEADMALLNNRWKKVEETSESEAEQPVSKTSVVTNNVKMTTSTKGVVPPAPPPPAPGTTPSKTGMPKSEEEQKIKAGSHYAFNRTPRPYGVRFCDPPVTKSLKLDKEFENTLKAMGFAVESTSSLGHVAKIDLTPHKQKSANQERSRDVTSEKLEGGRTKITVEERKITSTTFKGDKVTVNCNTLFVPLAGEAVETANPKTPPMLPNYSSTLLKANQTSSAAAATATTPGGSSIYNIIRKGSSVPPQHSNPVRSLSNDLDDSTSSFEDEPEVRPVVMREKKATPLRPTIPSTASSEYSDTADSQTGEYTEEYTEDETADETAEETAEETADETAEDYSDEDDYSEEESGEDLGVDELLGEVMDDTMADSTESELDQPKPLPRHNRPSMSQQNKPSMSQHNFKSPQVRSPSMKSNNQPHTLVNMRYREKEQTTSTASSGSDSDYPTSRRPVSVYSVDVYKTNNRSRPSPKVSVVRHSDERQRHNNREEPLPYIPEKSVKERMQELQEMVNQEQTVIIQTSNALNQCCGENSAFANSKEAVECHRLLLVAYKKRETYLGEMTRLREGIKEPDALTGTLTISDIRLPLKRDYMNRIGTDRDTTQHFFICLLRNGDQLMVTKMVSTHDDLVKGTLDIPNILHLDNIRQNFKLDLDIYSMRWNMPMSEYISRDSNPYTTPSKKVKTPKKTPLKGLFGIGKSDHRMLQSPAGPSAVRSSNFSLVATLPLTMRSLGKTHFTLDRVPYQCPLQGTVHLTLSCLMESHIEERGFLTMFEDVTGFGAWHRRWCVLKDHRLAYWKYPSDERCKEPMGFIDLKTCISDAVGLIPRDICARPHTFELVTMRRAQRGEKDNLTKRTSANTTIIRHQLSADTKDERIIWCERLNDEMRNLRAWHSDAMPAMKVESGYDHNTVV